MTYPDRLLADGERVAVDLNRHARVPVVAVALLPRRTDDLEGAGG